MKKFTILYLILFCLNTLYLQAATKEEETTHNMSEQITKRNHYILRELTGPEILFPGISNIIHEDNFYICQTFKVRGKENFIQLYDTKFSRGAPFFQGNISYRDKFSFRRKIQELVYIPNSKLFFCRVFLKKELHKELQCKISLVLINSGVDIQEVIKIIQVKSDPLLILYRKNIILSESISCYSAYANYEDILFPFF